MHSGVRCPAPQACVTEEVGIDILHLLDFSQAVAGGNVRMPPRPYEFSGTCRRGEFNRSLLFGSGANVALEHPDRGRPLLAPFCSLP